mmetsp:Transcript_8683/g.12386  ORF Transcript_8683/g.12386 Transcript_8683/m.12386 type:complete len:253 (-) Transcript_8683:418-1176(-)
MSMFIDRFCNFYVGSTPPTIEDFREEKSTVDDAIVTSETEDVEELKSADVPKVVDEPISCPGRVREVNLALQKEREEQERILREEREEQERILREKAAALIQSRTRTLLAKNKSEEVLRQQAATCIQSHARGMITRKSTRELVVGRMAALTRVLAVIERKKNTEESAPMDQERDEKIEKDDCTNVEEKEDRESAEKTSTEKAKKSNLGIRKVFSFSKKRSNKSSFLKETDKVSRTMTLSPKNVLPRHRRKKE